MPIYNQVYTGTITSGGGTINLDVADATVTRYVFSGTATLAASWTIQSTGTAVQGMEFDIRWQATIDLNSNNITIFGRALTDEEAISDLIITVYYNGSAWEVDVVTDGLLDDSVTNAKLAEMPMLTIKANNTGGVANPSDISIGNMWTMLGGKLWQDGAGNNSVVQINPIGQPTAPGVGALATNQDCVGSGNNTFAGGDLCESSGYAAFTFGIQNLASEQASFATGQNSIAARYGQRAHTSFRVVGAGTGNCSQHTLLTPCVRTTSASSTELRLDGTGGSKRISVDADSVIVFEGKLTAIQIGGSSGTPGDSASWFFKGHVTNIGGTTSLVDSVIYLDPANGYSTATPTQFAQVASASTWTVAVTADDTNDALAITVTGQANKTIVWYCVLDCVEIVYA